MQPRCTPSLYPAITLTQQHPVIYQKMPKDNPDTRFPIPMLRNDTSAQHHRSSFTDFVDNAFQCDFSSLLRVSSCLHAFIATFFVDIFDVLDVYETSASNIHQTIYNEKQHLSINFKFRLLFMYIMLEKSLMSDMQKIKNKK